MEVMFTLTAIMEAAGEFCAIAGNRKVYAFHGQMGVGKTTFILAVCRHLQVSGPAGSPTYSIINAYAGGAGTIYHIDLYRLKGEEEAIQAGVEDCLYSGSLCFVEWPGIAPGLFPPDTVHVYLEAVDESTRRLTITDK